MPGSLRPLNRRGLLGLGAATTLGAALVGCTRFTDPVVHGTNSVTAPPIPSPDPAFVAASDQVVNLLAVLTGVPDSPAWVPGARAMLTAHLDLLTARDPLAGQPTPDPWLTPSPTATPAAGIDQFEKRAA